MREEGALTSLGEDGESEPGVGECPGWIIQVVRGATHLGALCEGPPQLASFQLRRSLQWPFLGT
jgi:hypothetical protein